ncbi:hypothetical protein [Roseibium sp. MMSF_3412]|uniref:hypothetical protein n=1 Tax=Roseibium sp. MMSF_3412 TaxID=3046712 RepID=UPI00273FB776|nr:hypothetical protein [Roseibium sp. MMSF_3412]
MIVTPVPAVDAMRSRQKSLETPAGQMEEVQAASRRFSDLPMVPVHVASAALRSSYHGADAEYATQLLAGSGTHHETLLERQDHVRQYAAVSAYEDDERSHTVSLST